MNITDKIQVSTHHPQNVYLECGWEPHFARPARSTDWVHSAPVIARHREELGTPRAERRDQVLRHLLSLKKAGPRPGLATTGQLWAAHKNAPHNMWYTAYCFIYGFHSGNARPAGISVNVVQALLQPSPPKAEAGRPLPGPVISRVTVAYRDDALSSSAVLPRAKASGCAKKLDMSSS